VNAPPDAPCAIATAALHDAAAPTAPVRPLRILVAEDNVVNQKVAQLLLRQLGQRADLATNGAEAVSALKRQDYDLVLMDCQMPELDGFDATREIRAQIPKERQPYIVAMTANARESDRQDCLTAGMDDYISKPVNRERLGAILAELGLADSAVANEHARDRVTLERLRAEIGTDGTAEVVDAILAEAQPLLAGLLESIERSDLTTLRRVAHTMKSNAAMVGADALAASLQELEQLAASGALDGAAEKATEGAARYRRLLEDLVLPE
jgi:CheY-like chemotaxis protein